jgi:hypothetical protein
MIAGVLALLLLGLLLLPGQPDVGPPQAGAPHIDRPEISPPPVDLPKPDASNVAPPLLYVPTPAVPAIPEPDLSFPEFGGGNGGQAPPKRPAGPEHRTEFVHVHHNHWLWWFDFPLLALCLIGLAVVYPLARMPKENQRAFGAIVGASLVALAVGALVAGINPRSGPGTYHRDPPEIERSQDSGSEVITKRIDIHHDHPPTDAVAHWIFLGLGLAVLAVPGTRVARPPTRRSARTATIASWIAPDRQR